MIRKRSFAFFAAAMIIFASGLAFAFSHADYDSYLQGASKQAKSAAQNECFSPDLNLTEDELALFRLGFAMGLDEAYRYLSADGKADDGSIRDYVLNKNTHKFHLPTCDSVQKIKKQHYASFTGTRQQVIDLGYAPCRNCSP